MEGLGSQQRVAFSGDSSGSPSFSRINSVRQPWWRSGVREQVFVNQGHYELWAVRGVLRVNVFYLLGLGVPGILNLHAIIQSYHKRGNTVLNYPLGG